MEEAVHGSAGHQRIAKEGRPLLDGPIGGNDRRAVLVALADDLVEVDRLVVAQRAEASSMISRFGLTKRSMRRSTESSAREARSWVSMSWADV